MVSVLSHNVAHHQTCGGLGFATVVEKKKESTECNSIDEIQHDIKRPIIGLLCRSCISCTKGKCYFAFRGYPDCYLVKF